MSENQEAPAKEDFVPSEATNANTKTRVGIVRSTGMNKTIVVEYTNRVPHPRFKKIIKQSKKFYAHDEEGEAAVGDKVRIVETTPISKLKRWKLVKILSH
jgi:small subunit ribosomal protein S17